MGAALVALCLLAGDLDAQASFARETGVPETQGAPGFVPGILAFQASVASESRAGEAPLASGTDPKLFVAEILIPRLALELRNPGLVFSAWYSPRIFWEYPNPSTVLGQALNPSAVSGQTPNPPPASEPFILHTFALTLDAQASRNVAVTAAAIASIGEPDYTTLPQVVGTVQPTLPQVAELASVSGQARVADKLTPRWGVSFAGLVSHWQYLNVGPVAPGTVTGQTSASGEPAAGFHLTARDALGLGTAVGLVEYSYGAGAVTVTPNATWKRRLDRVADLNLKLGLTYLHLVGSPPPEAPLLLAAGKTEAVTPIGSAEIVVRLARRDEIMFLGRGSVGVDYFLDPVVGNAVPRGTVAAELAAVSAPSWTVTLRGDFGTALESVNVISYQAPPDETAFSLSLSVRRRVTENFYVELGGRWANRGPTLDTPDFRFDQLQLWAYLSLIGTTRPIPRPTLPRE